MYFDNFNLGSQKMNQNPKSSLEPNKTKQQTKKFGNLNIEQTLPEMSFQNRSKDKNYFLQPSNYLSDDNNNLTDKTHHISSPNSHNFSNFFSFNLNHLNCATNHPNKKPKFNSNILSNEFNDESNFRFTNQTDLDQHTNQNTGRIWHERPVSSVDIPSIFTLQPELWAIIFKNLSIPDKGRVARTCRFFRDVVYNKSVWKGDVARFFLERRYSIVLESLKRRGIKSIQILGLERGLKELSHYIPNLKDLNFSGCVDLTDNKIVHGLTNNLLSLEALSLSMCKHISDISIMHISLNLTSLLKFDVSGCINITDQSLLYLIKGLSQLKSLNLKSCTNITHKGLAYICGYRPPVNNENEDQLDTDQDLAIALVTEQPKVDLSSALVNLEELILQDCQKINDDVLKYVPLGLIKLKSLNLSLCNGITEFGLKNLANHSTLESLSLRNCNNISDIGLRYLSEANLTKLTNLDVSFCEKVNDQALDYIAQGLKELKFLSLNNCSITDKGLIKVGQNLIKLVTLNVGQCTKITEKSLLVLIKHCLNLESIDLYGCTKIKNFGFEKIKKLPKFSKLNFNMKTKEENSEEDLVNSRKKRKLNELEQDKEKENRLDENNNNIDARYLPNWLKDTQNQLIYDLELNNAAQAIYAYNNYQLHSYLPHLNSFLSTPITYHPFLLPTTISPYTQLNTFTLNQLSQLNSIPLNQFYLLESNKRV